MKKLYILFIIALFGSVNLFAQNYNTKKADKHFARFEYLEAAKNYVKLFEKGKADTYVYARLADCYYNIFNTIKAERWYAKALKKSRDPETTFRYAQMLKANGKYEQYKDWMGKFGDMRPEDHRVLKFKTNPNYLPKILEKGKKFIVQNLELNSTYSDFGSTLKNGKLYITSARNIEREIYGWNEEPFLDIMEVKIKPDGSFGDIYLLEGEINTEYHEGTVTFSPNGNTIYFSRESFYDNLFKRDSITKDRYGVLNLYKATKNSYGGWDTVESLPFNSKQYSNDHPSLSQDGKTLYFTSDMPGGYGSSDLYKVAINNNGSFGTPVNLGQTINTEGREMFPFLADDKTIYFSSDGHLGLGGLDVFFTKEIDGKIAPLRNIGIPVNSNADDFAFVVDEYGKGFVSSNRMGGKGSDDIYSVNKLQPICAVITTTLVTDSKNDKILVGATATIFDDEGNILSSKSTDENGKAEFLIECGSDAELQVIFDNYESQKVAIIGSRDEKIEVNVALNPIEKIIVQNRVVLNPIYFDFDKSNITAHSAFELDKLVQIMIKYPDLVIKTLSHTDSRGSNSYNLRLSDKRARTTAQYVISKGIDMARISGLGKGENEPIINCNSNCKEDDHKKNRRSEFIVVSGGSQSQLFLQLAN